jgi:biopolymer transport protein ExbD
MKNTILHTITIITLSACSLFADSPQMPDEAALLRQDIEKQERILQEAKEKLAAIDDKNVFEVSITSEGLKAGGKPISIKELEEALTELSDDAKILIRAEPTVSYKEVVSVMELCTKAGLKNVALATTKAEQSAPAKNR